jgi:hypothetical protein
MLRRKGLFWLASMVGASLAIMWSGAAYAVLDGEVEVPQQPMVGCDNLGDQGRIGTVYTDLGQVVGVPIYIGSNNCINNFRFEFLIPPGLEYDHVAGGAWTLGFDDPPYAWDPETRHLIISHMTGGSTCLTPNINNVFITVYFSTCSGTQHTVRKDIAWAPNPEPPSQPLNWLGVRDGCVQDPINTMTNGWVWINAINITFDIAEETATIGQTVDVTVSCTNSYIFNQFTHYLTYDAAVLEPVLPILIPTPRTEGTLGDPFCISNVIFFGGSKPGGYGTSAGEGAAFYKLRFRVIVTTDGVAGAINWLPAGCDAISLVCGQSLRAVTPQALFYYGGSVTVPPYNAIIDFGDMQWSNQSNCEFRVPILLKNNYPVTKFELAISYSDNYTKPLQATDVESIDPLNWPLVWAGNQICGVAEYARVETFGEFMNPYLPSADFRVIGWLHFQNAISTSSLTYTLQLVDFGCPPGDYPTWDETRDDIRGVTRYALSTSQFDGNSGTITIGPPLAQVSVPAAMARWRKIGGGPGYYESFAFSGIDVRSNAALDSVWFNLTWDATKFCVNFSNLSPGVQVTNLSNGSAYIRVANVAASYVYQRYGTIRVDNKKTTTQSGGFGVTGTAAIDMCDHVSIAATGSGGGIYVGPGGSLMCADTPNENMMKPASVPERFELLQNYPNPFNASTIINFDLAEPGQTTLEIINIMGQRVATPFDSYTEAGRYSIQWNGRDDHGQTVASGVYLYRLQSGKMTATKKMVLMK